jgi:hypothetical protein
VRPSANADHSTLPPGSTDSDMKNIIIYITMIMLEVNAAVGFFEQNAMPEDLSSLP